jgi:hypothetical protein
MKLPFLKKSKDSLYLKFAKRIIKENESSLTAEEIWTKINSDPSIANKLIPSSDPIRIINEQLASNYFGSSKPDYFIRTNKLGTLQFETKPGESGGEEEEWHNDQFTGHEIDYHRLLSYFAYHYLNRCYTRSVHLGGGTGNFNLFPDLMGCRYFYDYAAVSEVKKLIKLNGNSLVKLYSFEVKKELDQNNFSLLREYFLEAVNNSSWANEGYLAVSISKELLKDDRFVNNSRQLSEDYGIGIIHLDKTNPNDSRIIQPARTKEVDYQSLARLAQSSTMTRNALKYLNKTLEWKSSIGTLSKSETIKRYASETDSKPDKFDHIYLDTELKNFYNTHS